MIYVMRIYIYIYIIWNVFINGIINLKIFFKVLLVNIFFFNFHKFYDIQSKSLHNTVLQFYIWIQHLKTFISFLKLAQFSTRRDRIKSSKSYQFLNTKSKSFIIKFQWFLFVTLSSLISEMLQNLFEISKFHFILQDLSPF